MLTEEPNKKYPSRFIGLKKYWLPISLFLIIWIIGIVSIYFIESPENFKELFLISISIKSSPTESIFI
ncbi:MAG: hypothetical protein ABEK36_03320, partial [Candidatus Aenigmatarchaeota archaeon]